MSSEIRIHTIFFHTPSLFENLMNKSILLQIVNQLLLSINVGLMLGISFVNR